MNFRKALAIIAIGTQVCLMQAAPSLASSISDLGNVMPLSINNRSQLLVVIRPSGELAIWRKGKLTHTGMICPHSAINMNDAGHILVKTFDGSKTSVRIWQKTHNNRVKAVIIHTDNGSYVTNKDEVLVNDRRGVGLYDHGEIHWFIRPKVGYAIQATAVNDKHQFVGTIMGPLSLSNKPNPAFSARIFVWERGAITYLKGPGAGFVYPFSINNHGQIVGEFRPAHAGMKRVAILWRSWNSSPLALASLLPKSSLWQLEAASGINDKGEIIGIGVHQGAQSSFILSSTKAGN